jgi:phosphoesterase RecJ-like protein
MFTKEDFDKKIDNAKKIVVTAHKNPDPDAFCSVLAVNRYIELCFDGKDVTLMFESKQSKAHEIYEEFNKIQFVDDITPFINDSDLTILLDADYLARFTDYQDKIDLLKLNSITIDHHPNPIEESLDQMALVDPKASSTTLLIADLLFIKNQKVNEDKDFATYLLGGIVSDTGGFAFVDASRTRVLNATASIMETSGVNMQNLYLANEEMDLENFEIIKKLMENTKSLELENAPALLYSYISEETSDKYDYLTISKSYRIYMHNYLRKVKGYPWGFVVSRRPDRTYSLSFRSSPGAPVVSDISKEKFGGGGHLLAAGGIIEGVVDVEEACERVIKELREYKFKITDKE